jgi:hypothetical protein
MSLRLAFRPTFATHLALEIETADDLALVRCQVGDGPALEAAVPSGETFALLRLAQAVLVAPPVEQYARDGIGIELDLDGASLRTAPAIALGEGALGLFLDQALAFVRQHFPTCGAAADAVAGHFR